MYILIGFVVAYVREAQILVYCTQLLFIVIVYFLLFIVQNKRARSLSIG